MGRVYVAVRRGDPERALFAIKRLHPHLRDDEKARRTLGDEARFAGNVSHPHVLRVHEAGHDDDGPYLAMEYIEGISLAELFTSVRRADEEIPMQVCLEVARQMALGLHAIHEQAGGLMVVHRDVSPQNVLVDFDGVVRIADFGIAKPLLADHPKTQTGILKGKVGYMSPEQLRFETPDRRSDLFALGVVLYELMSGARLYHGSDGNEGARRILNDPPPDIGDEREDAGPEVVQLLFVLLAKSKDDRPADAREVADRLSEIIDLLSETDGRIDLGSYTGSFFERGRSERKRKIQEALERGVERQSIPPPPPPPAREQTQRRRKRWRVKGAAIMATVRYLLSHYGESGYARVIELIPGEHAEALEGAVLMSTWYEGRILVELTQAARTVFGDDALSERLGAASADFAFEPGGPYEVFRVAYQGGDDLDGFFKLAPEIWSLYHDAGAFVVDEVGAGQARLRVKEGDVFQAPVVDRVIGFIRRGLELAGAQGSEVASRREGDDLVFIARWESIVSPAGDADDE